MTHVILYTLETLTWNALVTIPLALTQSHQDNKDQFVSKDGKSV